MGQSVWLDDIRRDLLVSGGLDRLIQEQGVVGITSNPTIFNKAIAETDLYDADIERLVGEGRGADEVFEALALTDIRLAADRLLPVHRASSGLDGWVSLEVSPDLARDTASTIAEAVRLRRAADRPNVFIKVPATAQGVPAIRALLAQGVCVNVTLIFSLRRYTEVMEAYVAALEERSRLGQPLEGIRSVASFFVSRVDTIVDKAIDEALKRGAAPDGRPLGPAERGELEGLRGRAAVANARLAYQLFRRTFAGPRWEALRARGANLQRPLWASTSTKNPAYPDTLYVDELVGPDTVNTMPGSALRAFDDHGRPEVSIERDLEGARRVTERLEALGVALQPLFDRLEAEGVESFARSFHDLHETLEARCAAERARKDERWSFSLGEASEAAARAAERVRDEHLVHRVWGRDATLWGADPAHQAVARSRLGWLDTVEAMSHRIEELEEFASGVRQDGFRHAVLLGMGGSSLCPEVCRRVFGVREGFLELTVLDDTSPEAVAAVASALDWERTLFLVSSKSGTTLEVDAFYRYFRDRLRQETRRRGGDAFVAITDPGTPLEALGRQDGFRRAFLNPADIGGRYSALSYFGLVPAALLGVNLAELLSRADRALQGTEPTVSPALDLAARLGATIAGCAMAGRDKLTLVLDPAIEAFGGWAEQLLAESLGKDGKGVVPVDGEPLGDPSVYGRDRLFVHLAVGDTPAGRRAALDALRAAGHPVLEWTLPDTMALAGEFFRWEMATAIAGALIGVDPFDEPNVAEAKSATRAVLAGEDGGAALETVERNGLRVAAAHESAERLRRTPAEGDAAALVAALTRPGDYVAIQAYLRRTPERHEALLKLRAVLRERTRCATTLGYGPRFLHSTGQLHKGGPDKAVFLQLVAEEAGDVPVPGRDYSFRRLRDAQAAGDLRALVARGRRVLSIRLAVPIEQALGRLPGPAAVGAGTAPAPRRAKS